MFDLMRQGYSLMADTMMKSVAQRPGPRRRASASGPSSRCGRWSRRCRPPIRPSPIPSRFNKAIETNGQSLATGFQHLLRDLNAGQLSHVAEGAFEVGRNIATTPGKVVHETPLYQLIQYSPTTGQVLATPLVIFPPWINRFYILDLTPEKSFIRWAVEQGLTVFMVSWKSADATMKDVVWDDYIAAQIEAIDTIRDALDVPAVHTIGYCVAGTTLAATLAVLAGKGEADKVASATFFTAQVDFSEAGELLNFIDDALSANDRSRVGRRVSSTAATSPPTFNQLRGKDLIWGPVANHYLLGKDYPAFDLLHWNGDVTNLPAKWHKAYLMRPLSRQQAGPARRAVGAGRAASI